MHHNIAECKVLPRHRMLVILKGDLGNSNRLVQQCFYTAFVETFIFDQSLIKHEALTKLYHLTINPQISSFGSSPNPNMEDKRWRIALHSEKSSRTIRTLGNMLCNVENSSCFTEQLLKDY